MKPLIYVYQIAFKVRVLPKRGNTASINKTLSICSLNTAPSNDLSVTYYDNDGKKHDLMLDKQFMGTVQLFPTAFTQNLTSSKRAIAPVLVLQYFSASEENADEIFEELVNSITSYLDNLIGSYNEALKTTATAPLNNSTYKNVNSFSKRQLIYLQQFRKLCENTGSYTLNHPTPSI
ncbi:hypothetical protein ABC382_00920 [Lysinibacillus sp. 1P01SD]|uniref:hypothetical protein n=1 Tax=Lysinibacillus sp. 1P01SD TaxID=3132285 RepID=UPI0039A359FF